MPRRPCRPYCRSLARAACVLLALQACAAAAQTSPYYLGASQTLQRESNLLRLSTAQQAPEGYSQADTVSSTALLAGVDQTIGRQHVYANLALRNNRYSKNGLFNNTGYSAVAGLDWQTIARLSGSLSASANRSLQRFSTEEIGFQNQRNLESVETLNASANLGLVTQYSLELTAGHRQVSNSLQDPGVQSRRFMQDNAALGLRWRPSSAASLGVALGSTQGRYPRFRTNAAGEYEADRFRRNDVEFSAALKPSGISTLDARISSGRTRYDLNQQRNFGGVTGSLAWGWQPTGKLRTSTSYTRETGQESYLTTVFNTPATSDYSRVTSTARVQFYYDFSAKVALNSGLAYYDRAIVRTIDNPIERQDASGRELSTVFTLGARWVPTRWALLGCDYSHEGRRGKGELTSDLRASSFGCYGQITLQ
jgi:hypothetical protein